LPVGRGEEELMAPADIRDPRSLRPKLAKGPSVPPDIRDLRTAYQSGAPARSGTSPSGAPTYSSDPNEGQIPVPTVDPSQITSQAWNIINPQLQAAADQINRRSQMVSGAIGSATDVYAQRMGAAADVIPNIYKAQEPAAKNVANYARNTLTNAGTSTGDDLSSVLAQAGVQGPGDINLPQQGAGAGQASYGTGIAELDALIAKAAAAQTEAALEPGFARGLGAYNQNLATMQLGRQLSDLQSQIAGQVPGLVQSLTQDATAAAQDARDYNERVREYNKSRADTLNANRAKIVGPNAPTTQGRLAYWQGVAEQRTKYDPHGYVYEGTTTGIHPVKDKATGKPIVDPAFTLQHQAAAKAGIGKPQKVTLPDGRTGLWDPNTNTVTVAGGTNPAKPPKAPAKPAALKTGDVYYQDPKGGWHLNPKYKLVNGEPVLRSKSQNPAQKSGIYGTAPHRNAQGQWVTKAGRRLSSAGQQYWDGLLARGITDGAGHITKPSKTQQGGTTSSRATPSTPGMIHKRPS
jgi:hypothetical protein